MHAEENEDTQMKKERDANKQSPAFNKISKRQFKAVRIRNKNQKMADFQY